MKKKLGIPIGDQKPCIETGSHKNHRAACPHFESQTCKGRRERGSGTGEG